MQDNYRLLLSCTKTQNDPFWLFGLRKWRSELIIEDSESPNNEQDVFRNCVRLWNFFVIRDFHIKMSQEITPTSGIIRTQRRTFAAVRSRLKLNYFFNNEYWVERIHFKKIRKTNIRFEQKKYTRQYNGRKNWSSSP